MRTRRVQRAGQELLGDLKQNWRAAVLVDLVHKLLAVSVTAPLLSITFHLFLALSGREILTDTDILFFVISPVGLCTTVVVGALSIAAAAMEQASLLAVICAGWEGKRLSVRQALWYSVRHLPAILDVASRLVVLCLVITFPFGCVAWQVYRLLLTRYDINYYLQQTPSEFWWAVGAGVALVLLQAILLLPRLIGRMLALPVALFEHPRGGDAMRTSLARTSGKRKQLALACLAWWLANLLVSSATSATVAAAGMWLVQETSGTIELLVPTIGLVLIAWLLANFATTLLANLSFAALLAHCYRWVSLATAQSNGAIGVSQPSARRPWHTLLAEAAEMQPAMRIWTRPRAALGLLLVAASAIAMGIAFLQWIPTDDEAQVVAHRGASVAAPENTLAAIQAAIDAEADWVEFDVQESADGVVVVAHDSDLKKIGGSGKKVWESTAGELQQVDIGSWFDKRFADQRVPTLAEVLSLCRGKIRTTIELKFYGHNQRLEQRVIDLVKQHRIAVDDVMIISLKQPLIQRVRQLEPDWTVGLLTAKAIGRLDRVPADVLAVNSSLATRAFIRAAHRQGKQVFVWTVNDPLQASRLIGRGADAIITDNPAMVRRVMAHRASMTTLEKLLLDVSVVLGRREALASTEDDA